MKFKVGELVRIHALIDFLPYTRVDMGEAGVVVDVNADHGVVNVRLDKWHKGLQEWDNCVLLAGTDLDAITSSMSQGASSNITQEETDAECGAVYRCAGGGDGWVWRR